MAVSTTGNFSTGSPRSPVPALLPLLQNDYARAAVVAPDDARLVSERVAYALLLHHAEKDDGVNVGIPAYEAALKANNKKYTIYTYPGTQHAFNNDTGAARYNEAAAKLAWSRTLAFFKENLGSPPRA